MNPMRVVTVSLALALMAVVSPASATAQEAPPPVPEASGVGRRVVYANGAQRVWLVEADGSVAKTHLVSGRRGYPKPGSHSVFSRSEFTRSGSVSMRYMVRFTRSSRLAVGFHSIPVNGRGRPIQSEAQLGTPRSRGCVRQSLADARFLWDWAPIGTPVTVIQ